MNTKIVDASVMAAWLFGEPRRDEAFEMMDESRLFAPELLTYELSNVALIKTLQNPEQEENIRSNFDQLFHLEELQFVHVDFQSVLSLALDKSLTTYDASYLHLSRALEVPLLTFDQELKKHV
ncbi:MAG: type II toxin-antitoxin system VapC family toxin [bacterium]